MIMVEEIVDSTGSEPTISSTKIDLAAHPFGSTTARLRRSPARNR